MNAESRFLVGAAVGSGLAALAAERGGADFLLALNAGRMRVKGAASIASILPVADGNNSVLEIGKTEIIPQVNLPVYFGANVYLPETEWLPLIREAKLQGFAGFVNFPTAIHLPQDLQQKLEHYGIGFSAELAMLARAKKQGLHTLAYVRTKAQAIAAAESGVETICLNFGWNIGGSSGVSTDFSLEDVAQLAGEIHDILERKFCKVKFMLEGGPIETAEQVAAIYQKTAIDGYIGGSTLDKMPIETSISDRTFSFKGVEILASELQRLEEEALRESRTIGLLGGSQIIRRTFDRLRNFSENTSPTLIYGESGSGRSFAAEAIHSMGSRKFKPYTELLLSQITGHEAGVRLFGRDHKAKTDVVDEHSKQSGLRKRSKSASEPGLLESLDGGSLYIEDIELLPRRLQVRLARYLQRGNFTPLDGRRAVRSDVRIICASQHSTVLLSDSGTMDEGLCTAFFGNDVYMPPLRERQEDVPKILRAFIAQISRRKIDEISLDSSVLGVLSGHSWPGNISELRRLATRLAELSKKEITSADILATMEQTMPVPAAYLNERDWIASALKRNRYRRSDTAKELGVSRKTLYNKLKKYGLE